MKKKRTTNLSAIIAALLLVIAVLGCAGDDKEKANTLIDEANKFVSEGNKVVEDVKPKSDDFDKRVREIGSNDDHTKVSEFGKTELVPLYEKMRDSFQKASDKFDAASKLKVADKFKEYLDLKASEFKKRAEFAEALKAIPKTLTDSKDENAYQQAVKKDVEKVQSLAKEAQALAEKAEKVKTDNADIFKKS